MIARQSVRWAVRATIGLALNLALLTLWVDHVGLRAELAIIPNWVLLSTAMYVVTDRWVFAEFGSPPSLVAHLKQFVGSESIMFASKAANYGIYVVLLQVIDYRLAWVAGAGVTFVASFGLNHLWWQRTHST